MTRTSWAGVPRIVRFREQHREWVTALMVEHFGSPAVVSRGRVHDTLALPGLVALDEGGAPMGFLSCALHGSECEIVALVSSRPRQGIGRALVEELARQARTAGSEALVLVTTNDNVSAQEFYRNCGFSLVVTRVGAIAEARELKRDIPLRGEGGVPIEDELEYRRELAGA